MATYIVKKGDTLSAIAQKYGTTYQQIAKDNGISNPNLIRVGQELKIGGTTTESKTTTPTTTTAPAPSFQYEEFKYDPYTKSDVVQQAEAMLQQHTAQKPGEYQSNWQTQLDDTLNQILNREKFTYDLNGDALYQQYKDQYTTQGKQAMMDTMGQAATMTGGYGNSYAQTVGQQTYQGYLQQLNDRVPELYQLALNQYNQEGQDLYNLYGLYADRDSQDYGRHRDKVSDYYTDLQYLTDRADTLSENEYNQWMDKLNLDYGIHSDKQTYGYQAHKDANEMAMSMLSLGVMPSADILATAGISSSDAQAIVNKVAANEKKSTSSGNTTGKGAYIVDSQGNVTPVGNPAVTEVPDEIKTKCAGFESNTALASYLDGLEASGKITEEQADQLYAEYSDSNEKYIQNDNGNYTTTASYKDMMASTSGWSVVDDGGVNWLWGVDRDAVVKAPNGEKIRLSNLIGILEGEGMSKSEAKKLIKKLQKNLGI
jgi:murein DD-endopeptidase MepM/ murein hydrolase activator NlpD